MSDIDIRFSLSKIDEEHERISALVRELREDFDKSKLESLLQLLCQHFLHEEKLLNILVQEKTRLISEGIIDLTRHPNHINKNSTGHHHVFHQCVMFGLLNVIKTPTLEEFEKFAAWLEKNDSLDSKYGSEVTECNALLVAIKGRMQEILESIPELDYSCMSPDDICNYHAGINFQ